MLKKTIARKYIKETIQEKLKTIEHLNRKFMKVVGHLANPLRNEKIIQFRNVKETALQVLTIIKEND